VAIPTQHDPNPSQAADVKRADGCIAGAEGPSEEQLVMSLPQAIAADLIAGAAHRLELHHTPLADQGVPWNIVCGKQSPP
jgi:hypothetical protein